ncbi:MAG: hypothetical protein ABIG88_02665 [Patescibacteria group bacterium]|nr:hypothetical protein [Patescibacteria group bacterium]
MRIELEIPKKKMWKEVMKKTNGIETEKDLINNSIALFEKIVDERIKGKIIVLVDKKEIESTQIAYKEIFMLSFPPLGIQKTET